MQSPYSGSTVSQGSVVLISGMTAPLRYLTYVATLAKTDGSSNTTIIEQKTSTAGRVIQIWNVTADNYPVGDYNLQIVVTPGSSVSVVTSGSTATATTQVAGTGAIALAATTTTVTVPVPTQTSGTLPSVYYWRALIHVQAPSTGSTKSTPSSAAALTHGTVYAGAVAIAYKMALAMGVLALGCVLTL
ncbi:hypothetical protein BGZ58_009985 [Dissophora ornata]|nr:hypothetical protein BGZ58_009985 [Dissophora ornata]